MPAVIDDQERVRLIMIQERQKSCREGLLGSFGLDFVLHYMEVVCRQYLSETLQLLFELFLCRVLPADHQHLDCGVRRPAEAIWNRRRLGHFPTPRSA